MYILTRCPAPTRWGLSADFQCSDTAWPAAVKLGGQHGAAARASWEGAWSPAESRALAQALTAAIPHLPPLPWMRWMAGMERVRALGRAPNPAHYWTALVPQLRELIAFLAEGGMCVRHGSVRPPSSDAANAVARGTCGEATP